MNFRAAFGLLLTAGCAQAATLTYTGEFSNRPAVYPFSFHFTVPKFDPALGELLSVESELIVDASATVRADNEMPAPSRLEALLGGTTTVTFGPMETEVILFTELSVDVAADDDGAADYLGADSAAYGKVQGDNQSRAARDQDLAFYIGAGETIPLTVLDDQSWSVTGRGDFRYRVSDSGSGGTWSITYVYSTPVPEPGAAGLAGLGVALLAARRTRKSQPAPAA